VEICHYIRNTFFELQALRPTARQVSCRFKTRSGHDWSDSRIKDILTDLAYRGTWLRNTTSFIDGVVKQKPEEEFVWLPDYFKVPVFTPDDATRIDAILNTIKQRHTQPLTKQKYLLTQIKCECGGKVYGRTEHSGKRAYKCKKCPNKVDQKELDAIVLKELFTLRDNEDRLLQLKTQIAQTQEAVDDLRIQRKIKVQELEKMDEAISTTIEIENKNILTSGSVQVSLKKFQSQKERLGREIEEIDGLIRECVKIEDIMDYLNKLSALKGVFKGLSENLRSRLVALLIPEIILSRNGIKYTLDLIRQLPRIDQLTLDSTTPRARGIYQLDCGNLQRIHRG